jgi:hypothetical protein
MKPKRMGTAMRYQVIVPVATAALLPGLVLMGGMARATSLPRVITASLTTISCKGNSFCMAAGTYSTQRDKDVSLTQVWNGKAWHDVPGPPKGSLDGISCGAATFCFANNAGGGEARWNGRAWKNIGGSSFTNLTCAGPKFCMQLFYYGDPNVFEWNGKSWQDAPGDTACSNPGGGACGYSQLSCGSPSFCLAISYLCDPEGGCTQGEAVLTWIWNGKTWYDPAGPDQFPPYAMSCSWGVFCMLPTYNSGAEIWSAVGWQSTSLDLSAICHGAPNCNLNGPLSCGGPQDCVVAPTGSPVSLVWTDFKWKAVPFVRVHGEVPAVVDLSCSGTNCMAVGSYGSPAQPVAEHWNGTKWQLTNALNR